MYKDKEAEVLKGIKEHRVEVMPKIMVRMKEKLNMLLDCKKKYDEEQWQPIYVKNFYRSLDTKSIALKGYEKKVILSKGILKVS